MMAESFPDIMTIQETSNYLRIPVSSLYKLAQEGKIPSQKVGRHWRFHRVTLEKWIAREIYFDGKMTEAKGID
jgi:excisionase family DNA binding protein